MDKKEFAKKYLKTVIPLFAVLLFLSALIIFGISALPLSNVNWSTCQKLLIAICCAYLPCASFTGFCLCFGKVQQLGKIGIIMICVLFPLTLALITVIGVLVLIPAVFYAMYLVLKNNS